MERSEARLAVLIDADNTAAKWADAIFEEIATLGEASVRRIYGDFFWTASSRLGVSLSRMLEGARFICGRRGRCVPRR